MNSSKRLTAPKREVLQMGDRYGRFVIVTDRDGVRFGLARGALSIACESIDGGCVLVMPGGRLIQIDEPLETILHMFS